MKPEGSGFHVHWTMDRLWSSGDDPVLQLSIIFNNGELLLHYWKIMESLHNGRVTGLGFIPHSHWRQKWLRCCYNKDSSHSFRFCRISVYTYVIPFLSYLCLLTVTNVLNGSKPSPLSVAIFNQSTFISTARGGTSELNSELNYVFLCPTFLLLYHFCA